MMATSNKNTRWQCGLSLSEGLSDMRSRGAMTDVTFLVGPAPHNKVNAHRLVLSSRSPVFCVMFDGPLTESRYISIPDIHEDIFDIIIRFMYGENIEISKENVEQILYASEKYDLESLKTKCDVFLSQSVEESKNKLEILELSRKFNLDNLLQETLRYIENDPMSYLGSDEFLKLSKDAVKSVFDCDGLPVEEIDVYRTAVRWGEAECTRQCVAVSDDNIRKIMGPILYSIRFPVIDGDLICEEIDVRDILKPDEKSSIFRQMISTKQQKTCKFINKPRLSWKEVTRFDDVTMRGWNAGGLSDSISFTIARGCLMKGILMYKRSSSQPYTVTLQRNTDIISILDEDGTTNAQEAVFELYLPKTIHLDAEVKYSIAVSPSPYRCYGQNGKADIVFGNNRVVFSACGSSSMTNVQRGQIAGLLLSTYCE